MCARRAAGRNTGRRHSVGARTCRVARMAHFAPAHSPAPAPGVLRPIAYLREDHGLSRLGTGYRGGKRVRRVLAILAWMVPSGRALALAAMLVQVLFYADHMGASAARAAGVSAAGARLGFLQICTGEGVIWATPDGQSLTDSPAAPMQSDSVCALCIAASMFSFDNPDAIVVPIFQTDVIATLALELPTVATPRSRGQQQTPIRAPPVAA